MFVVGTTVHSRVMLVGQKIIGGVVLVNVMIWTHPLLLPQASRADQVRRIIALPVQLVVESLSTKLMFVTALQESMAVATPVKLVVGASVHSRVISAGQRIVDGTVSLKLI